MIKIGVVYAYTPILICVHPYSNSRTPPHFRVRFPGARPGHRISQGVSSVIYTINALLKDSPSARLIYL